MELEKRIESYIHQGYRVTSQTDHSASLVKPKKFSLLVALLTLILGIGIGFVIYVLYFVAIAKDETVYLTVGSDGHVRVKR